MTDHRLCGGQHWTAYAQMRCCCGDTHHLGDFVCCGCGHHHDPDGECKPAGPCGSYVCCIN
jgi:hypothetical protein